MVIEAERLFAVSEVYVRDPPIAPEEYGYAGKGSLELDDGGGRLDALAVTSPKGEEVVVVELNSLGVVIRWRNWANCTPGAYVGLP